jgi:hypothetical protein
MPFTGTPDFDTSMGDVAGDTAARLPFALLGDLAPYEESRDTDTEAREVDAGRRCCWGANPLVDELASVRGVDAELRARVVLLGVALRLLARLVLPPPMPMPIPMAPPLPPLTLPLGEATAPAEAFMLPFDIRREPRGVLICRPLALALALAEEGLPTGLDIGVVTGVLDSDRTLLARTL